MDVFEQKPPKMGMRDGDDGEDKQNDPRLQPTPDFGSLGPSPDVKPLSAEPPSTLQVDSNFHQRVIVNPRVLQMLAVSGGMVAALLASSVGSPARAWEKIAAKFMPGKKLTVTSTGYSEGDLDRQNPQKQAEILLTRAVSRPAGNEDRDKAQVEEQIQSHIEGWRGKLNWNSQLSQLTTAALNSEDSSLRVSAIEVQLAAYGLNKSDSTVDVLVRRTRSSDHSQKVWALWSLGLLGNRGVQSDRVVEELSAHLKNYSNESKGSSDDEDSRRWAVESLALVGTNSTIPPLLDAMHNDPSALVRERAACSLAESGMLTHEQRLAAVPQLINYTDDPGLDAQTHSWAFQALGDITRQHLPNDSAAWREWYQRQSSEN